MTNPEADAKPLTPEQLRALDAKLAVAAFGFEQIQTVHNRLEGITGRDGSLVIVKPVPHFSTDPVASDALLGRMAELGFWYRVQGPFTKDEGNLHFAGFTEHGFTGWNGRPDNQAGAATKYLAIALAAAKALGIKEIEC